VGYAVGAGAFIFAVVWFFLWYRKNSKLF
jgi:hypothetical protein